MIDCGCLIQAAEIIARAVSTGFAGVAGTLLIVGVFHGIWSNVMTRVMEKD